MSKNKKFILISLFTIFIAIIICMLYFSLKNNYSRESMINLIKNASMPSNIYIENTIYNNENYIGLAKFYIKDNKQYLYQENNKQEQVETFIDNENNSSIIVLHSEKAITQNALERNINFELPLKNNLLDKLNNTTYSYTFHGKEKVFEINCLKISLVSINNEKYDYYLDENTGYIVQYEHSKNKETYEYEINSVLDEHIKTFNINNYKNYNYFNSI